MEEDALQDAWSLSLANGFKGGKEDFTKLLQSNSNFFDLSFNTFKEKGFEGDKEAYSNLLGVQPTSSEEESKPLNGGGTPFVEQKLPVGVASREELISNIKDPYIKRQEEILLSASNEKKKLISELPIQQERQKLLDGYQPLLQQKQQELQQSLSRGEITEEEANNQLNSYYEKANQQINQRIEKNFKLNDELRKVNDEVNEKAFRELNAVMKDKQAAIDLAYQEQIDQLSPLESMGNALFNSALMTSTIPAKTVLLGEQLAENFTVDLPIALYGLISGEEISDETKQAVRGETQSVTQQQSAYKEIKDTEEQLKPTLPFIESLEKGQIDKASAAAVGTSIDFLRSIITGAGTLGTGTFGEIGAPMYMDAVRAKAKETGKKEEDIIAEDLEDETTALLSAGLATAAEYYGLGTATKFMKNAVFKQGVKDQVKKNLPKLVELGKDVSVASLKESGTEVFQQSIEEANKAALDNGGIGTDEGRKAFLKEGINSTFTKQAAETGASTFAGSMLLFGMGKGAGSLRRTKSVIDTPTQLLSDEDIKQVLDNKDNIEVLSEQIKGMYQAGVITEEEYKASEDKINTVLRYDSELSPTNTNREEGIRLLAEREQLENEIESLHPTQRGNIETKITKIDEQLINIANGTGQASQEDKGGAVRDRTQEQTSSQETQEIPTQEAGTTQAESEADGVRDANVSGLTERLKTPRVARVGQTFDKVTRGDQINENEIAEAQEVLLKELDINEKSNASPEIKAQVAREIEAAFNTLDNYEFTTETKTRAVTKKTPIRVPKQSQREQAKSPQERLIGRNVERVEGEVLPDFQYTQQEGQPTTVIEEQEGKLVIQEFDNEGNRTTTQELSTNNINDFELAETIKDESGNVVGAILRNKDNDAEVFSVMDEDLALDLAVEKTKAEIGELTFEEETILEQYEELKKQQDATEQQSGQMREQGDQEQTEGTVNSNMPKSDRTELQDGKEANQKSAATKKEKVTPSKEAKAIAEKYGFKAPIEAVNSVNDRTNSNYNRIEEIPESQLKEVAEERKTKQSIIESVGDDTAVRKGITDYINDLEKKGRITVNQSANWLKKLNNTNLNSKKAVGDFITSIEKGFKDAALKQRQSDINSKVKRAGKRAKGKSKVGQAAKAFSKINTKKIENQDLLDEIEIIAEDLLTKSPTTTVRDINDLLSRYNKVVQDVAEATPQKSIEDRIKDYKTKRDKAESFSQFVNVEIERQKILGDYLDSEDTVDPELLRELEATTDIPIESKEITTAQLASQSRGNITRANNAIEKALKDGVITEEKANELKDNLKEQIDQFKADLDKFQAQESKKYNQSVARLKKLNLEGVEADEVRLLLEAEKVDDPAWLSRFNAAAEAIVSGNIPFKEISDLREFSASKSKRVEGLVEAIEEINPKGLSLNAWIKRLGTKEAAQRARNILNTQRDEIYKMVYQPMTNAFTRAKKMSDTMLKDFLKVSTPSIFRKDERGFNRVGMIAQYLREASLAGSGVKADGVEVGNRDIFGIWLGNEAAMDAAGLSDSEKAYHRKGQAKAIWNKSEQKNIQDFYDSLPKTAEGYVDVAQLSETYEKLLTPRELKILRAAEEVFEKGRDRQEAANLRRGVEFNPQVYYVPTQRKGRNTDVDATTKKFDKFSPQARQGKEKITESLRPTMGVYPVNIAEMVINYAEDTSVDYVFSEVQPITNAVLNTAISKTKGNVIASAIKGDYNASLDYEKSIGAINPMLTRLLGARYAKSLFDFGRSVVETMAALISIPIKVRSTRGIVDTFNKDAWKVLRQLEELTGADIADFKSGDIERKGVKEAVGRENIFIKAARYTISAPEYITAITGFMPVFRREFYDLTGEAFDKNKFINDKAYRQENLQAIKDSTAKAQELVERIYGAKSKGGTRRFVEVAPSKMFGMGITKNGEPVTVQADSSIGRLVSFFGNFGYREQGEFFQSLKFIAQDVAKKGELNRVELANAAGVLANAVAYSYLMGMYYLTSQIVFGDDDEAEKAEEEMKNMFTTEGLTSLISNQLTFLAISKYGKSSRGAAILTISALYNTTEDKETKEMLANMLKDNFFINKPVNLGSKYDLGIFASKELLPAVTNVIELGATAYNTEKEMREAKDIDAVVATDLAISLMNLSLAVGSGTQLPMSNMTKKAIEDAKRERKKREGKKKKKKPFVTKYNIN